MAPEFMSTLPTPSRVASLDALRGFDMFWILGLHSALESLLKAFAPQSAITKALCSQFTHVRWEGFHFYDLIFPLFVFLAGVSSAIALPRRVERDGVHAAVRHLGQRAALLFVLGVFYNGGLERGLENVRRMGVLQRIGIVSRGVFAVRAGFRAGTESCYCK